MSKRSRDTQDQQEQDSVGTSPNEEPENKRFKASEAEQNWDQYEHVTSEALRFLRLAARSDVSDESNDDDRDDSTNEQMRLLIEEFLVEYDQLLREATEKLKKQPECSKMSDTQIQAIFDSLPIGIDVDVFIITQDFAPHRDLICENHWSVQTEELRNGGKYSAEPDLKYWVFLSSTMPQINYFVVQVSHVFNGYADEVSNVSRNIKSLADIRRLLRRHHGHPDSWPQAQKVVNVDYVDGSSSEEEDHENYEADDIAIEEREEMDENERFAHNWDDPFEMDVVHPKYRFDQLDLMSGESKSSSNALAALLEIFASFDALEQLRMDSAGDSDAFAKGLEALCNEFDANLLDVLSKKAPDRQVLFPYFDVLAKIVRELLIMENVCVVDRSPHVSAKRQYEFWVPIVSRAVANEFAVYSGDDLETEEVKNIWTEWEEDLDDLWEQEREEFENRSDTTEGSIPDDLSGESLGEIPIDALPADDPSIHNLNADEDKEGWLEAELQNMQRERIFQLGDFRAGRADEHTVPGAEEGESAKDKDSDEPSSAPQESWNLDITEASLIGTWPKDRYERGNSKQKVPGLGGTDCLDTLSSGKSIVSRFAYTKQDLSEGPLMDQNWANEADEYIDPTGSLSRVIRQTQGTDSLLPDIIRLCRRGGILGTSAQSLGEAVLALREFLHSVIGKIIDMKHSNVSGDSEIALDVDERDVITVFELFQPITTQFEDRCMRMHLAPNTKPLDNKLLKQCLHMKAMQMQHDRDIEGFISKERFDPCDTEETLAIEEDVLELPSRLLEAPMGEYHIDDQSDLELAHKYDIASVVEQVEDGVMHEDLVVCPSFGPGQFEETDESDEEYTALLESIEDIPYEERQHLREISLANKAESRFYIDSRALSRASLVFKAMLSSGMQESTNQLLPLTAYESLITKEQLGLFLQYILDGDAQSLRSTSGEDRIALHQAALFYQMNTLVGRLESMLIRDMSVENVIDTFIYGDLCERRVLISAAEQFLRTLAEETVSVLIAEAKRQLSNAENQQRRLHNIEWDYLYLVGTKTTLQNVALKLHDVLRLEEEMHEINQEGNTDADEGQDTASPDGDDIDDEDVDLDGKQESVSPAREISSYVRRMLSQRYKEQLFWIIIRNYDRVCASKAWRNDEYLSAELKDHIGELVHAYRYGVPSDLNPAIVEPESIDKAVESYNQDVEDGGQ